MHADDPFLRSCRTVGRSIEISLSLFSGTSLRALIAKVKFGVAVRPSHKERPARLHSGLEPAMPETVYSEEKFWPFQ
jgi:hypothetical protein